MTTKLNFFFSRLVFLFAISMLAMTFLQGQEQAVKKSQLKSQINPQAAEVEDNYFRKGRGYFNLGLSYSPMTHFFLQHLPGYTDKASFSEDFRNSSDGTHHFIFLNFSYEKNLTKHFTLGGIFIFGFEAFNGENVGGYDYTFTSLRFRPSWHFPQGLVDPYVGVYIGNDMIWQSYVHGVSILPDIPTGGFGYLSLGVFGGVRINISESVGFYFESNYPFPLFGFGFYFT